MNDRKKIPQKISKTEYPTPIHNNKKMKQEIHCACEFLSRMLETRNLPVQFVNVFKKRLEELLLTRFENHWDTANPSKGSAYRCIRINGRLDPVIRDAAKVTGLTDISTYLPAEFTMWIDPREVSYRFGEEGSICNCPIDSMNTSTPLEWSASTTIHNSGHHQHHHHQIGGPVSRSRTSPIQRRYQNGKYSPTPKRSGSQSPPLYLDASPSSAYRSLSYNHHRLEYVIPVQV